MTCKNMSEEHLNIKMYIPWLWNKTIDIFVIQISKDNKDNAFN